MHAVKPGKERRAIWKRHMSMLPKKGTKNEYKPRFFNYNLVGVAFLCHVTHVAGHVIPIKVHPLHPPCAISFEIGVSQMTGPRSFLGVVEGLWSLPEMGGHKFYIVCRIGLIFSICRPPRALRTK
jgi:hypothetical protein